MDCQENEYWELSKDCGYGEDQDAYCIVCPPQRYKSNWGHHRCQTSITFAVMNCAQKTNSTGISNAICLDCLPRFYQKTPLLGYSVCIYFYFLPSSKAHSAFQLSLMKADVPTVLPKQATLVTLMNSLLVTFALTSVVLFFLYCKQFFNRNCQLMRQQKILSSLLLPGQEPSPEYPLSENIFENKPLNPTLDDEGEYFIMAFCVLDSHSHWIHTPIECMELDLQKFSNSATYPIAQSCGNKIELNVLFQVLNC
uniref:Ectodysplasin A2 receptor n=1 Tax=Cavia porcellus TaxID=10141 RepID=H0VKS7_CAVPO